MGDGADGVKFWIDLTVFDAADDLLGCMDLFSELVLGKSGAGACFTDAIACCELIAVAHDYPKWR